MGISLKIYIGPYVKITKGVITTETKTRHFCSKCDKDKTGKFCDVCGTEISVKTKTKEKIISDPCSIIEYLGYDWIEFEDTFSWFNYIDHDEGANMLTANYHSSYIVRLDRDDMGKKVEAHEIFNNTYPALCEFKEKGSKFFDILKSNGVGYDINYGVTLGGY